MLAACAGLRTGCGPSAAIASCTLGPTACMPRDVAYLPFSARRQHYGGYRPYFQQACSIGMLAGRYTYKQCMSALFRPASRNPDLRHAVTQHAGLGSSGLSNKFSV